MQWQPIKNDHVNCKICVPTKTLDKTARQLFNELQNLHVTSCDKAMNMASLIKFSCLTAPSINV